MASLVVVVGSKKEFISLRCLNWKCPVQAVLCSRCLKITEKVSFNIASEASYVYILSGQKFIKMPKMVHFGEFWKPFCDILNFPAQKWSLEVCCALPVITFCFHCLSIHGCLFMQTNTSAFWEEEEEKCSYCCCLMHLSMFWIVNDVSTLLFIELRTF